jgi:hypothetical protein
MCCPAAMSTVYMLRPLCVNGAQRVRRSCCSLECWSLPAFAKRVPMSYPSLCLQIVAESNCQELVKGDFSSAAAGIVSYQGHRINVRAPPHKRYRKPCRRSISRHTKQMVPRASACLPCQQCCGEATHL